jgi:hypothetical protein
MANSYITLGGQKLDILYGGIDGSWDTNDAVRKTLNNKTYKSLGTTLEEWSYDVKVRYVPQPGYAGYSQLRTWRFDRTVAGNMLAFVDEFGTNQGNVTITDMSKPKPVGRNLDGGAAVYTATIKLIKTP